MSTPSSPSPETQSHGGSHAPFNDEMYEGIDLRDVFARLMRGLVPTLGLALLGLVIAAVVFLAASPFTAATTSMRVAFAFDGAAQGQYPDKSKFEADDIRSPDLVVDALKRLGLDTNEEFQSKIRAALTVEGIIPPNVIRDRDRLRVGGQIPPPYIPDEYAVTLTLPRSFPLTSRQREQLLNDIAGAFRTKFQRTYANVPLAFGSAFETLRNADYFQYELVLNQEVQNITDYLNQQLEVAKNFRSQTTNLTFSDLIQQTELFDHIQLNQTLGLILQNGLSRNRDSAMVQMNYYLQTLEDQDQKAVEDEKVVQDLLTKAQERSQNVVLGIKSQVAQQRPEAPILDQGLVDSLLANDAYNFLVRRALDAGLKVKAIQAEKAQLLERRKSMEEFLKTNTSDQSAIVAEVQKSLASLQTAYDNLISNVRKTYADFARQQYADSIRVSMPPVTGRWYKPLAIYGAVGAFLGLALGMGLSLLGIYIGAKR